MHTTCQNQATPTATLLLPGPNNALAKAWALEQQFQMLRFADWQCEVCSPILGSNLSQSSPRIQSRFRVQLLQWP